MKKKLKLMRLRKQMKKSNRLTKVYLSPKDHQKHQNLPKLNKLVQNQVKLSKRPLKSKKKLHHKNHLSTKRQRKSTLQRRLPRKRKGQRSD